MPSHSGRSGASASTNTAPSGASSARAGRTAAVKPSHSPMKNALIGAQNFQIRNPAAATTAITARMGADRPPRIGSKARAALASIGNTRAPRPPSVVCA
ncbi:hypothetical protein [Lysobacter gummosus]|uniref:hypothetical protein n=1 Tax=Lysobacter gummosus TaxID=262324 RepID=UPI0036373AEC